MESPRIRNKLRLSGRRKSSIGKSKSARSSPRLSARGSPRSPKSVSGPNSPKGDSSAEDSPRKSSLMLVLGRINSPVFRRKKRSESFVASIYEAQLDEFELVKELASGFIGRVYLAKHKVNREYFAIKIMSKEGVIAHRQLERVFNEKKIHLLLSSQKAFQVVKAYKTFMDDSNIYLLMEYQPADLFSLLNQMKRHVMPESHAQFLIATLVTTLECMHYMGVVYRDLKPQNILIDEHGYPMLTDFGFSKILNLKGKKSIPGLPPQTISFVGTPAYMAPELLTRKYYAEAVDWWALGILAYEVLLGDVPFDDHGGDYDRLLNGIHDGLFFPEDFSPDAKMFITRLLDRNPDTRLGANGVDEIRQHAWLKGQDWEAIKIKKLPSPLRAWIPKRRDKWAEPDSKHFDLYQLYERNPESDSPVVSPRVLEELFEGY